MQHEIEHLQPNRDALKWALGCVSASYVQRIVSLNVVRITATRWILALFIASWATNYFFAARFVYLKTIERLGYNFAGSDSANFISALSKLPSWSIFLDSVAGTLYVIAACSLMRKKAVSTPVLIIGTAINAVACASQLLTVFMEFDFAPSIENLKSTCITYALQIGVIILLWDGFSRDGKLADSDNK